MTVTMFRIRRRMDQKQTVLIGRMTPEEAKATLTVIRAVGGGSSPTIFHAAIRDITGGYRVPST